MKSRSGVTIEEAETLREAVVRSGKVLQVGHMKRFDAGLQSAKAFIENEMGDLVAIKAWYCDSTHRYAMTDAIQPLVVTSANAKKPAANPKADLRKYYMLAHGCHLIDTARYLAGDITSVQARLSERSGICCWFVDVEFANGALVISVLPSLSAWIGMKASRSTARTAAVLGKTFNPGTTRRAKSTYLESPMARYTVFWARTGTSITGQLEGLADVILNGAPRAGATIDDGIASVRSMVAIARSVEEKPRFTRRGDWGRVVRLGIFAKTFEGNSPGEVLPAAAAAGFSAVQYNMACSGLTSMPDDIPTALAQNVGESAAKSGLTIAALSGTYNMIHPGDPAVRSKGHERL